MKIILNENDSVNYIKDKILINEQASHIKELLSVIDTLEQELEDITNNTKDDSVCSKKKESNENISTLTLEEFMKKLGILDID